MVRGPGVEADTIIKDVVVNIDLAPTIVEMGGGELNSVDGISFLSSLVGNEKSENFIESNDIYLPQTSKIYFDSKLISF